MDGVHPTHNVQLGFGWIKKGVDKMIPANTGRSRLNLIPIVDRIIEQGADYVIALKANQRNLVAEVANFFDQALAAPLYAPCESQETPSTSRGQKDRQEVWVSQDLDWLPKREEWKGLSSVVMVHRKWEEKDVTCEEKRYYITSLTDSADRLAHIVRRHWSIENELHWHLDVTFREDASQIGATANENLRVARMAGLELLRAEKMFKKGLIPIVINKLTIAACIMHQVWKTLLKLISLDISEKGSFKNDV